MAQCKTKIEYLGQKTSLLSWTEDMQCWSFSLPAGKEGACPMAVYGENSICGGCYAMLGRYNMPNVMSAQWIRFLWLKQHLETEDGTKAATQVFVDALNKHVKNNYFRWFDSGDLFSLKCIDLVYEVCQQTPNINHWFPTRSWQVFGKT